MLQYDKIDVSEGIYVNKTNASKECMLCYIGFDFLKMWVIKLNYIFVINVTMF